MSDISFMDAFFNAYLAFQAETRKTSVTAFAKYLSSKNKYGVVFSQQLVSGWLNGDFEPGEKYIHALADVIGDEIYDILNFPRPDPNLQTINKFWAELPEEFRRHLRDEVAEYISGSNRNENGITEDPR